MQASASSQKIVNKLETIVKKSRGKVSPADLAAETGFSLTEVNDALGRLVELYESRVGLDYDTGKLQFAFKYPLYKRSKKSFKEIAQIAGEYFWKVFKVFYKALTGIILIAYFVVFLIILLILMSQSKDNRDNPAPRIIGGLFQGLMQAFYFSAMTRQFQYAYDPHGYRYKSYKKEDNKGKNFVMSIFNFVFGPELPKYDPLADAQEVAAFIRQNNGRLTAGHIVALTGVDYATAESRLAEYTVKFSGEFTVDENGIVVAEFPQMLNKVSDTLKGGKVEYYIDEIEAPYVITGNSGGRNTIIILMNTFNLLMSLFLLASGYPLILGLIPFVFSASFLLIPLIRIPIVNHRNNKRKQNIIRKSLIRAFIGEPENKVSLKSLIQKGKLSDDEVKLAPEIMKNLVLELQGQLNIDTDGTPLYSFDRLGTELKY